MFLLRLVQFGCLVSALGLLVVTLLQVTKAETSGTVSSMGFGSIGGRSVNTPVGTERILKPLTLWFGVTFLFSSALQSLPEDRFHLIASIGIPAYVLIMSFRHQIAAKIREMFPNVFGEE